MVAIVEDGNLYVPYVPSLPHPNLQTLTALKISCNEVLIPVSLSNRLLEIALKECVHLRFLDLTNDLILDACQEFRDIMAELTENLRLQSLRFIVRYSPTEDEDDEFGDFRMEDDPYPHLYDATRLLLERCPELRHLYLQSGKFENVSEEELSSMVLRNCPQLDTFVYDNHQKPLFGYTDLDAGRRYQNMCVITNSRLVNGFVSILQHLRNNLKVLRLTSDGIRGASWKTLKDLGGFPHLTLAHPRNVRLQRHP